MKRASFKRMSSAIVLVVLGSLVWTASAFADSAPVIESELAANITQTDATLEAQIDPNGAYTGYEFQIDTNSSYNVPRAACPFDLPGYAECDVLATGEPLPPGLVEPSPAYIPASSGGQSVSLDLASIGATLQPGTTYHYRVIASNGGSVVTGPDQTFTTPAATAQPSIDSESATNVTPTNATLNAQINPNGLETTYKFLLVPSCSGGTCLTEAYSLPVGSIPASSGDQGVSLDLNEAGVTLHPGTEYHYSVEATNSAGPTVYGSDQTFTTPSELPPPNEQTSGTGGHLPAIRSPASASPSHHRRHHRRHERGLHQSRLHRASHVG